MTVKIPARKSDREAVPEFSETLARHGLDLRRDLTTTLQVNVGLLCNQACNHCHLDAGPGRRAELMGPETMEQIVALAGAQRFKTIDITGGAPEMHPGLADLIRRLTALTPRLILRSNLTAINDEGQEHILALCLAAGVTIIASFPALNPAQTEAQRGRGVFRKSLAALKKLNSLGYGRAGSGLELNLVANPAGAFLPASQQETEKRFKQVLLDRWGIEFNSLYTFANAPLGRFRTWLVNSGNLDRYMQKLFSAFNPCAVAGLMCRTMISVSWDGYIYDCDFNQALPLPVGTVKTHVKEMRDLPGPEWRIAVSDHCYTCTAGAGFT